MARRRKSNRENNRIIAGLLAFVGGTFGIHRFYLNDVGGGIFYIVLFFITMKFFPVTMILGIIEALKLFNMDPDEFDKKYNQGNIPDRERRWRENTRSEFRNKRPQRREPGDARRRPTTTRTRRKPTAQSSRYVKKSSSVPRRNPFKTSGMDKYKEFDLEDAIVDFNKALKIAEKDPDIHFYLASAYSLTEEKDKAFKHLDLAVQYDLKNKDRIDSFEDLAYVRIQEEYDNFKENGYRTTTKKVKNEEPVKEAVLDDDILLSQLNKLAELRKKGLISEEEFLIEKEKLIDHN